MPHLPDAYTEVCTATSNVSSQIWKILTYIVHQIFAVRTFSTCLITVDTSFDRSTENGDIQPSGLPVCVLRNRTLLPPVCKDDEAACLHSIHPKEEL